jgi:hypothetical protein
MRRESSRKNVVWQRCGTSFALLLAISGVGCAADEAPAEENTGDSYVSFQDFEARTYREPESGIYIVDGDTPVDDVKKLEEFYLEHVQKGALIVHRQGGVDAKWTDAQRHALTYCVSTKFGARYDEAVQAMVEATGAWEAVTDVKYVHVTAQDGNCNAQNNNVLFDVRPTNSGGSYLARAFFPNDSRSSSNVLIDTSAFGNNGPTTLTGILRHELGHTLGFRHEHTRPESGTCFEDNNWRPLTPYDGSSVMHYPQCNGTGDKTLNLTNKDIQGAVSLYGPPAGSGDPGNPPPDPGNPPPDPGNPGDPPVGTEQTVTFSGSVKRQQGKVYGPIDIVAGTTFKVTMTGSGDPDLYVRFGAAPTKSRWDCRPYKTGPNEQCTLTVPDGETEAYIGVLGYQAGQYDVEVIYTAP